MSEYQGIAGGVNINEPSIGADGTNYGIGFGGGDLRRALEDGYSPQSILNYLNHQYTGIVPSGVRSDLESRAATTLITDKTQHPEWQLAAGQLVGAVWNGSHSAQWVIQQGWMDNIIRNAYGDDADTSINAIQTRDDVHDLIYNVGRNHWQREQTNVPGFPINGFSKWSPDHNNYQPTRTGVWHGVNETPGGTGPQGGGTGTYPTITDFSWSGDPNPNVFNRADVKEWYQRVFDETRGTDRSVNQRDLMEMRQDMLFQINSGNLVAGEGVKEMLERTRSVAHDPAALGNNAALEMDGITSWWGYYDDTAASVAEQEGVFKHVDWLAALAAGYDDYDIWRYMRAHPEKFNNADGTENPNARITFDAIEARLNTRGQYWLNQARNHESPRWSHYMPQLSKMPIWVKIQDHINTLSDEHARITWVDWDDMETLYNFIQTEVRNTNLYDSVYDIDNEAAYQQIIGRGNVAPGTMGTYTPGEYWSQYGSSGPPDRDQGDGLNKRDLTYTQKMVAQAGLHSADPGTYRSKLEDLENRFLDELYEVNPETGRQGYLDAPDEWGLDVMRLDENGDPFDWDDTDGFDVDEGSWYNTVAKGDIDWAFYRDSAEYRKAHEALGMDIDKSDERYADDYHDEGLRGQYIYRKVDTIDEIRAANVWVHGQHTLLPTDQDPALNWEPYVAEFNSDTEPTYTPVDLSITGYTRESRRQIRETDAQIMAPSINVPTDSIRTPQRLQNWDTLNPAPPSSGGNN